MSEGEKERERCGSLRAMEREEERRKYTEKLTDTHTHTYISMFEYR